MTILPAAPGSHRLQMYANLDHYKDGNGVLEMVPIVGWEIHSDYKIPIYYSGDIDTHPESVELNADGTIREVYSRPLETYGDGKYVNEWFGVVANSYEEACVYLWARVEKVFELHKEKAA